MSSCIAVCPLCHSDLNDTTYRLIKEICGHNKCRQCFIEEENGCKECQRISVVNSTSILNTIEEIPKIESNLQTISTAPCKIKSEWAKMSTVETVLNSINNPENKLKDLPEDDVSIFSVSDEWKIDTDIDDSGESIEKVQEKVREIYSGKFSDEEDYPDPLSTNQNETESYIYDEKKINNLNAKKKVEILSDLIIRPATKQIGKRNDWKMVPVSKRCRNKTSRKRKKFSFPGHILNRKTQSNAKYKCTICNKEFNSMQQCRYHLYCDNKIKKPYDCLKCNKSFVTPNHLRYHSKTHSVNESYYKCQHCDRKFLREQSLKKHSKVHATNYSHTCSECKDSFPHKYQLKLHMYKHSQILPHKCDKCDKSFLLKENFKKHLITHSGEKRFSCETCGNKFGRKSALKLHQSRHSKHRSFGPCHFCSKSFINQTSFDRHMNTHTGYQEFRCPLCEVTCKRKDNFCRHLKSIHPEEDIKKVLKEITVSEKSGDIPKPKNINNLSNLESETEKSDETKSQNELSKENDPKCNDRISDEKPKLNIQVPQNNFEKPQPIVNSKIDRPSSVIKFVGNVKPLQSNYTQVEIPQYQHPILCNPVEFKTSMLENSNDNNANDLLDISNNIPSWIAHPSANTSGFRSRSNSHVEICRKILTPYIDQKSMSNSHDESKIIGQGSLLNSTDKFEQLEEVITQRAFPAKPKKSFDPLEIYRKILLPSNDEDSIIIDDDNNYQSSHDSKTHLTHMNARELSSSGTNDNNFIHWRKRTSQCFTQENNLK